MVDAADADEQPVTSNELLLHHGDELVGLEANAVAAARPTRIIAVAGDVGAGKTTLLTSIYERFQRGIFGGSCFAGSLTLVGFERRCHASRIASGRSAPQTDRTRRGEKTAYLHFRLAQLPKRTQFDILFTDISGEDFQAAKDSLEEARRLRVLTRADHLLLLVDSARLIDRSLRFEASHNALTLLRSLHEAGMISATSAVDVLLSKFDLVGTATTQADHRFIANFTEQLAHTFATTCREFRVARIAARPIHGSQPSVDDLGDLLNHWVMSSATSRHSPHYITPADELKDSYDRFLLTTRNDA
jgi:hypothetical protein